jgi:hypothetical protein
MATPIKATPKLSNSQFAKLNRELGANKGNKVPQAKRHEMKVLVSKVLSKK